MCDTNDIQANTSVQRHYNHELSTANNDIWCCLPPIVILRAKSEHFIVYFHYVGEIPFREKNIELPNVIEINRGTCGGRTNKLKLFGARETTTESTLNLACDFGFLSTVRLSHSATSAYMLCQSR